MALSNKLMMRQGQSLVMTPQLLQAIKLLQFSTEELAAFLDAELERNPLLQIKEHLLRIAHRRLAIGRKMTSPLVRLDQALILVRILIIILSRLNQ